MSERTPLLGASDRSAELLRRLGSSSKKASLKPGKLPPFPDAPVGGDAGNAAFYVNMQLTVRLTVMAMLLGSLVWMPELAESLGMTRFAKHAALAICLMIFMSGTTVGGVINGASAGVSGCFLACFCTFMLRGFFPDGVEPGTPKGMFQAAAVIGWIHICFFNLFVLAGNFRMGFKLTAMAMNTSFMLCFLNPEDKTPFSKNFQINPNGAAVSAFIGTCFGSLCAFLSVMLPYPLGWSTATMKANAKAASEDICKLFLGAVEYYNGDQPSIIIDRQMAKSIKLKDMIGGLGGAIDDSFIENMDMNTQGTVRKLHELHATMLGKIFETVDALQIAMSTEDFGESHVTVMKAIGGASQELVDEASVLLCTATAFSEDGEIDASEKAALAAMETRVKDAIRRLSQNFHKVRQTFEHPIHKELMSEAFFVFCLSAFGRHVLEYSKVLREDPPEGSNFITEAIEGAKASITIPGPYHFRICSRYWNSLMVCLLFSVFIDNYSPACAVTAVFLINTRVGPDIMAMIQGLLSVVVGVVFNALMFSFSCKYGTTSSLMASAVVYWFLTLYCAKSGGSLSSIGLMMSALAPFAIVQQCTVMTPEAEAAKAMGLWGSIRALLICVVLTVAFEIVHIPGVFTDLTAKSLDNAFKGLNQAFEDVFAEKDVTDALAVVSDNLGKAQEFNDAAKMEPRFWKCPWKKELVVSTCAHLNKIRSDVLVMRLALLGGKGEVGEVFSHLNKVSETREMALDLRNTIEDSRVLTIALLQHEEGRFGGLEKLATIEGLNELDGYDEAISSMNKLVRFPENAPETMENDELCQLSIVFVMFAYLIDHVAAITVDTVKKA